METGIDHHAFLSPSTLVGSCVRIGVWHICISARDISIFEL